MEEKGKKWMGHRNHKKRDFRGGSTQKRPQKRLKTLGLVGGLPSSLTASVASMERILLG